MLTLETVLRQRYRLHERLGQGGMGAVYRATDLDTGDVVAVKHLRVDRPGLRSAFEREAHLLARLSHPALPSVSASFAEDGDDFLVMTFVPGPDLGMALLRRTQAFDLDTVLDWADQLLDVLTYLHTRQPQVIHRDIKPRNLKLDAAGRVVLVDFGLAKESAASGDVSFSGFTLSYAPLEQVRGLGTEPRSDLYALGATLYELLARKSPADAVQRAAALADGAPDPLVPLGELNATVPPAVAAVITQALALRPSQRPATARALQAALREAADGPVTVLVEPAPTVVPAITQPMGTVTFLTTEVRGEAGPTELARHDGLLRQAIDGNDGFVFRSGPLGVSAAFATAEAALGAALAAQRALRPLRARMALVSGGAELANGEYVSHVLPRLARLLEAGHGGQILLARSSYELVGAAAQATFRDLGSHRLRDLADAEHVYQVAALDLEADFPPLVSHEVRGRGLPQASSALVGRMADLTALVAQLRLPSVRLVTLTGPGGVGKTRLARHLAEALLDDFVGGVYFVPLAAVRTADLVVDAIAQALGVRERPGQTLLEALGNELRERHALLVLDNFEQVLLAAPVIADLIGSSPRLQVVVTSRTRPAIVDQVDYPVLPLPSSSSVELFVQRARVAHPGLVLSDETAPAIAALCARLDGLPLAIELAAARADLFTPAALLDRLERRLPVLTAGLSGAPARHQTLQATLAWSYELLAPDEQALFGRLGVFVGGFDLDAAGAVCTRPDDAGLELLGGLEALGAASLVRAVEQPSGGVRYEMLETVREYAAERLRLLAEAAGVYKRHAAYFGTLAETADAQLGGPHTAAWLARLGAEHSNLRQALDWLAEQHERQAGLQLAAALWRFWQVHGHMTEGRARLENLLSETGGPPTSARAKALVGAGALAWRQQDVVHARARLLEAVEACRAVGESAALATGLKHLGLVAMYAQPADFVEADRLLHDSLALRRRLGDRDGVASCLNDLAVLALRQRDYDGARPLLEESQVVCRGLDNRYGLSFVLNNLSLVALAQDDFDAAAGLLVESLTLARDLGSNDSIACALSGLACLAATRLEPATAGRLFGASEGARISVGVLLSDLERETFERHLTLAQVRLGPEAWQSAVDEGRGLPLDAVIDAALRDIAQV